jgi:hypothetical protein
MSPREQLLKMQRIILKQLKRSVHRLQGEAPPEIERYYQAYKREFKNYQKISNKSELLKSARQADIIFGADFHPFAQSQRTHLRILRELVKNKKQVVLALEAIDSKFQNTVEAYLDGEIDDKNFLRKINYSQSWGFPWENYKVLFDFAKTYDLPIYGINQSGLDRQKSDLTLRDSHSASRIVALRQKFPHALIYVVYGDLHLASTHLPRLTRKYLGKPDHTRFLTVFQDSETLYWRLAKRKLEERVDVLKLRTDAYCVVNSPPWIKWQAYLDFLEQTEEVDIDENLHHFIKVIQKLWKIDRPMTDFNAFSKGNVPFAHHISKTLSKMDLNRVMTLVRQDKSFFIPQPATFYFHSSDVNHIVTLAGQFIHSKMRRDHEVHLRFPQDMAARVWIEAIGFFASKLINNRRKYSLLKDLPIHHHTTLIALEQRLHEQMALKTSKPLRRVRATRHRRPQDYYEASRVVGAILGNRIYTAFQKNDLDFSTLHRWLRTPVGSDPRFLRFYVSVLRDLKNVQVIERSKNERL